MARLALLLAGVLTLAACGGGSAGDEGSPGTTTGATAERGVSLGGQTLDGESLSLDEFRGTPVFVNVWASW